jgi:hypothetical protein
MLMMVSVLESPHLVAPVDAAAVDGLRGQIDGAVVLPGEPGYDEARAIWNGMIDKRPALIVRPAAVADVQAAVGFARANGLAISIKGGGHNVAGHAVSEGGLMLDMSGMRGVEVDPAARTARVQGGALWSDFDQEAAKFGLATTGGVISHTGVAGLTLGGGIGWLVGKHGMSIDNLLSVELVTADGEVVTASVESHPDLFWALRGGGGNFGVATSFEFALHPQGDVLAGIVAWPVAKAAEVMAFCREFTETAPDEMGVYALMTTDPESGARVAVIAVCWPGDSEEGERLFAPVRAFGEPVLEMIGQMPYVAWQALFDANYPHGSRYYWKGNLLRKMEDGVLDAIVRYGTEPPTPTCKVVVEWYRGAMNRVDPTATAFAHRDAEFQIVNIGQWDEPDQDDAVIAWTRGIYEAIAPYSLNGAFLNFNTPDDGGSSERVRAGYGANLERLTEIKRRYDPTNLFRENNNIVP